MQFRRVSGRDSAQVVTPFVQVGTYPTRNFATLGNSVTPVSLETVTRSFLSGSPCRHGVRTVSSTLYRELLGVQSLRVPQYLFDRVLPLLPSLIHRECQLDDLEKPIV